MIWSLNFLAYAKKILFCDEMNRTDWTTRDVSIWVTNHVISPDSLEFPPELHELLLKYEFEIFKKTTSLYFAIWNSGSANDS